MYGRGKDGGDGVGEQFKRGEIRNCVLYPYQLVKDVRTGVENTDSNAVLDGDLDEFMLAYLQQGN